MYNLISDYAIIVYSETTTLASIFTALHGMHTRSCDENSVRPSVRPSICPFVIVTKRKKNLSRFLYHAIDHLI